MRVFLQIEQKISQYLHNESVIKFNYLMRYHTQSFINSDIIACK